MHLAAGFVKRQQAFCAGDDGLVDHFTLERGDAASACVGLRDGVHNGAGLGQILFARHEHLVQRLDLAGIDDGFPVEAQLLDKRRFGDKALIDKELITLKKDGIFIVDCVFELWFKKEMM